MENNSEPLSVPQFQEDRLSKLPDDILVGILSTLKLKEAAQTSVLSHRWLSLWTNVPRLHFVSTLDQHQWRYMKERKKYMHVFANWVNRVWDLRRSSYLREFRIICATRVILTNGSSMHQEWEFKAVNISGEAIECLLLKCPLLEDLRVVGSAVLVNLVVSGPSLLLKHLQITYCFRVESIKISDTNIVSLRVATKKKGFRLMLNNLPMLTEVWITGRFPVKSIFFSQLSCCLSQFTVMTLQSVCPETIMELYKFPELQNLRRLVLVVNCCLYKSVIGLTSLIDSCPRLVEFALMLNPLDEFRAYMEQRRAMEESLKGLKVFELYGYHGNETYEDELMMFFIENAVALEKIVIDPRSIRTHHGVEPVEDERAKKSRTHAVEKYKGLVPKQVELVIL